MRLSDKRGKTSSSLIPTGAGRELPGASLASVGRERRVNPLAAEIGRQPGVQFAGGPAGQPERDADRPGRPGNGSHGCQGVRIETGQIGQRDGIDGTKGRVEGRVLKVGL